MRSGVSTSKSKSSKHSLTDQILTFCASGRFGIREAIAAVTTPKRKTKGRSPKPQDSRAAG